MAGRRPNIEKDAELVRQNLKRFREELKLSTQDVADRAGIKVDRLRLYEQGRRTMDAITMHKIATSMGHLVDHFFMKDPPKANLDLVPRWMARIAPGMDVDEDLDQKIRDFIDSVNREQLERLRKRKK